MTLMSPFSLLQTQPSLPPPTPPSLLSRHLQLKQPVPHQLWLLSRKPLAQRGLWGPLNHARPHQLFLEGSKRDPKEKMEVWGRGWGMGQSQQGEKQKQEWKCLGERLTESHRQPEAWGVCLGAGVTQGERKPGGSRPGKRWKRAGVGDRSTLSPYHTAPLKGRADL